MLTIADFHIHSKYSRATSRNMDLGHLNKWAQIKGIKILGTGDFTHPLWFKELKEKLEPAENGLFVIRDKKFHPTGGHPKGEKLKNDISWFSLPTGREKIRFILTAEISCIYSKNNRTRKVHILLFAPDFQTVEKINAHLGWIGNIKADGRPILGLDAKELTKIIFDINPDCLIIPAHAWTPWFSVFGSNSGFDSLEECFDEYTKYIYGIETGLSSDPAMNWRLSKLDKITLISNSDAHSPSKIGREANVFDIPESKISYEEIRRIIKEKDKDKFLFTVEFFPEEGKYHYDGHRNCGVVFNPEETKNHNSLCPKCGKHLTIGVMFRVNQLADRPIGKKPEKAVPFKNLIPLEEIIADTLGVGPASKSVEKLYRELINSFGSEFEILLEAPVQDIERVSSFEIAEGISRVRQGKVKIEPGYDGEYGKVKIFENNERGASSKQASLF